MKRKLLACLLLAALLLTAISGAQAETTLCFVAMNDTVPLTLTDGAAPYYKNGKLYLPYTAFRVSPNGVGASYNAEKETFVLFNSNEMLLFDLDNETYTDNKDQQYEVDLTYRSGLLYVPASVAKHFGLAVTMLSSRAGYPIIRFTNGEQVYDDGMFVAQAENLINHVAQQHESQTGTENPDPNIEPPVVEPPVESGPVEVYLAFAGEAVSEDTVRTLEKHDLRAAFFLTEEQLSLKQDLVRAIYAAGHTIGVTTSAEEDLRGALDRANAAMDDVLFCRTIFALLPEGSLPEEATYRIVSEPASQLTLEALLAAPETPHLYIVRSGALGIIESFINADATLLQLLETSFKT